MLIIHIELFNLLIAIVSLYQLLGPKVIYNFSLFPHQWIERRQYHFIILWNTQFF